MTKLPVFGFSLYLAQISSVYMACFCDDMIY